MDHVKELSKLLTEDQVTTNQTMREQHSRDESYHIPSLPDMVIFPKRTEDVQKVINYANTYEIPVVPFGLGSSLEGNAIPYKGGISLDMSLMNQVLEVRPNDFLIKVQPGITRLQLNKELKKYGLFFTVDPGADATLGGMAATNASGTTSVRYGIMRDQVRDLEVVLASGEVIHTGGLSAKSSSGLHLNGLMVGSEGTLGVITELTLKVHGIPECIMAARATFPDPGRAVEAVTSILAANIPVARMEFVDEHSIRQVNIANERNYELKPTLFLEFHGNEAGLKQDVEFMKEIVSDLGCMDIHFEMDTKSRAELWEARHNLAYSFIHGHPGKKLMVTDVSLPITELAGAILHARESIENTGLVGAVVGHVGDGNYHALVMVDLADQAEVEKAKELNELIVLYALERGGTCTGEHGVGVGKVKYQQKEHGAAYEVMKSIKHTLDPKGIMNPGKIF
ncbi:FAD-binding protein [Alkalihalophilus marmarensis]|uniref:D-lactate dehydrogenase (cytochrome) n=1 Tax=Alkalihalophilus marmarensis DSM 21297 TaxID=1188261 RepID=U6STQ3_9BACI|nr:FAD-linked oxidase C-terminal domain-containing protein [Alkalihalophilus marmarensis]ERN55069.1 2-hydroxy-acid oxidase [Alkalihalophilus marmarensis DSM 21297]MCM3489293.1 FAD-binding protein [Alkalihalophilus marmarensis]